MRNIDVIIAFVDNNRERSQKSLKGSNLEWSGYKLYSYNTCIAQFKDDLLYINLTKYSRTTSVHQNILIDLIKLDPRYKDRVKLYFELPKNVVSVIKEY